jgi:C4-dicarboxylate transporter DctM subunit
MGIVLAAGCILESLPVTVIFAPILAPIAVAHGRRPGALQRDLPGRRSDRIHHPALRSEPVRRQRRHRHPVFEARALCAGVRLTISWLIIAFVPWLSLGLIPQPG